MSSMINFDNPPQQVNKDILNLPKEEQDYWIAMWFIQPIVLQDMRRRPMPSPPAEVKEYLNGDEKLRRSMKDQPDKYSGFWNDAVVKRFFQDCERQCNLNTRNAGTLSWAKGILGHEFTPAAQDALQNHRDPLGPNTTGPAIHEDQIAWEE